MKKIILAIILTINTLICFSQTKISEFKNDLKTNTTDLTASFSVQNERTGNIATFLSDKTNLYAFLTDSTFQVSKKITSKKNKRKYNHLIGSTYNKEDYLIIYSNSNKNKFALNKFDFNKGSSELIEDSFKTEGLIFLQSISNKNNIHLIFLKKDTSILLLRTYDINLNVSSTILDLSDETFYSQNNNKVTLSNLMYFRKKGTKLTAPNSELYQIFKITQKNNTPIALENTSSINKLYVDNDQLTFTFDKNHNYTQVVSYNLSSGDYGVSKIEKPKLKATIKKSNSIIIDNNIVIAATSKDALALQIKSLKDFSTIKEYTIKADAPINISNSAIIQEGATYNQYRELKTTSQLIYKINKSDIGVSALKINDNYEIIVGGVKKVLSTEAAITGFAFGTFSNGFVGFNNCNPYFNDFMHSYNSYSQTKSVYFKSILDSSFSHIEKAELTENTFDKIRAYLEKRKSIKLINIFKRQEDVILGGYLKSTKTYYFYKF